MDIKPLIDSIKKNYKENTTFIIGIDGRSGCGKSYLADKLQKELVNSIVIHLDPFDMYESKIGNKKILEEILIPLKNNHRIKYGGQGNIFILEGIFSLNNDLKSYYDYKIWIECPAQIGFDRGLKRDIDLNGVDNSDKWINYWLPKEEEYIKTQNPQKKADYIVDGA